MNKGDAFFELLVAGYEGRLRDSVGCLFFYRLYQEGKLRFLQPRDPLAAWDDDEVWNVDVVVTKDFLRRSLVLAKDQPGGAAAGEWHSLHLKKRRDVLIESAVVLELVRQVKNDVRRETLHFLAEQIEVIEDGEVLGRMSERAERREHVGLRFPVLGFHLLGQVLVDLGRPDRIE